MTDHQNPDGWDIPAAPFQVGMLLYPGFTLLDLAGPQTVFGANGQTHLIWKTMEPVSTDMGVSLNPTMTVAEVPTIWTCCSCRAASGRLMPCRTRRFWTSSRASVRLPVMSPRCGTGSVILGMAGLLEGYRAATHWDFYEPLEVLGIEASHERVAIDRNRITGGGVTAGVDFGLTVLAKIKGQESAEFTQLALEYAPEPPFNAGHPRTAKPETMAAVKALMRDFTPKGVEIAKAHRQRVTASSSKVTT